MTDVTALEAALDDTYQCVLSASFGDLPKIVAKTELAMGRVGVVHDTAVADRLRYKANRNGLCLQAAARGMRAALRRIDEMGSVASGLSTYTSHGKRAEVEASPGALQQRL